MPTVSCSPVSIAIFSLVPTPSVVETSTGSVKPAAFRSNSAPKPPKPPMTPARLVAFAKRLDHLHQRIAGVDIDACGAIVQTVPGPAGCMRALVIRIGHGKPSISLAARWMEDRQKPWAGHRLQSAG